MQQFKVLQRSLAAAEQTHGAVGKGSRAVAVRDPRGPKSLLERLDFASSLLERRFRLGLTRDHGLDHLDHRVLEALIVGEERLGTTIADAVDQGLPVRILGDELVDLG